MWRGDLAVYLGGSCAGKIEGGAGAYGAEAEATTAKRPRLRVRSVASRQVRSFTACSHPNAKHGCLAQSVTYHSTQREHVIACHTFLQKVLDKPERMCYQW
jgi:hypothetical protein